jgi:hypothetical protein
VKLLGYAQAGSGIGGAVSGCLLHGITGERDCDVLARGRGHEPRHERKPEDGTQDEQHDDPAGEDYRRSTRVKENKGSMLCGDKAACFFDRCNDRLSAGCDPCVEQESADRIGPSSLRL